MLNARYGCAHQHLRLSELVEVCDSFKTLGSIVSFLMICFEVTFIVTSKQIIQKRNDGT